MAGEPRRFHIFNGEEGPGNDTDSGTLVFAD